MNTVKLKYFNIRKPRPSSEISQITESGMDGAHRTTTIVSGEPRVSGSLSTSGGNGAHHTTPRVSGLSSTSVPVSGPSTRTRGTSGVDGEHHTTSGISTTSGTSTEHTRFHKISGMDYNEASGESVEETQSPVTVPMTVPVTVVSTSRHWIRWKRDIFMNI